MGGHKGALDMASYATCVEKINSSRGDGLISGDSSGDGFRSRDISGDISGDR